MIKLAGGPAREGGVLEKLQASAERLIRIRPVGDMPGNDPAAVISRIERYAPGFRDVVVASKTTTAVELADYNRNYVGGDFSAGQMDLLGLLRRPVVSPVPWRTPLPGVYLCSSSTSPGPGVTGMPGYNAAKYALKDIFKERVPRLGLVS